MHKLQNKFSEFIVQFIDALVSKKKKTVHTEILTNSSFFVCIFFIFFIRPLPKLLPVLGLWEQWHATYTWNGPAVLLYCRFWSGAFIALTYSFLPLVSHKWMSIWQDILPLTWGHTGYLRLSTLDSARL